MEGSQPVRTGPTMPCCDECGHPLPPRPPGVKEHRFCPGGKCRATWHRKAKQRALNAALGEVQKAYDAFTGNPEYVDGPTVKRALTVALQELMAAGAELP